MPHLPSLGAKNFLKYIGPGLLVTVGFIDPGNWASNIAAGASYGYTLLWVVTLSTIMLVLLQHNVAHLGIATGLCLSEAATIHTKRWVSRSILSTAMMASVSTSLAEILGGAIALNMLFNIPLKICAMMTAGLAAFMLFSNSYRRLEKWIIGFVSLIGLSFLYELTLVNVEWGKAASGWIKPEIPANAMLIVMSILGSVVMPHNLFLHSEIIQSREWNLKDDTIIKKQLDYEFMDTLFSMFVGWAINSAMIILAAAAFFAHRMPVSELSQAERLLAPLLGSHASWIFALALLFSGLSSSVTSGMAGGTIMAGCFGESYDIRDSHSRLGVGLSFIGALVIIFLINDPFKGLLYSQMALSIQLPFTIFLQIYLTSSKKVMGKFANTRTTTALLVLVGVVVSGLNIRLLYGFLR
ncbi:MAG: Nramp family divalent metal transporter [Kiritimatiellae bacterium]|nr:Nramp family divalent metal transporter [Kiritimatiellia bacterium]